MAKENPYSAFHLQKIEDVDKLILLIKSNGKFQIEDYNRIIKKAEKSSQPTRIRRRLIKEVHPLINYFFSKITDTPLLSNDTNQHNAFDNLFWKKDYKASDFVISDGKIMLGEFYLKSARIHKVHKSWLENIEHIFHIAPEYNKDGEIIPNRFHFVPYNDLSILLNSISEQMDAQYKRKSIDEIYREWDDTLLKHLHIRGIRPFFKKLIGIGVHTVSDDSEILVWDKTDNINPNISVPMTDVTVSDGYITVSTKNIKFTKQAYYKRYVNIDYLAYEEIIQPNEDGYQETPSWESFYEILLSKYNASIINEITDDLKDKYQMSCNALLHSIKKEKTISFKTYQSKKRFLENSNGNFLYLFLDKNSHLWYPFKYFRYINTYRFYDLISDTFEYDPTTVKQIAQIIDDNWNIIKEDSSWLLSDIIPSKHNTNKDNNNTNILKSLIEDYCPRPEITYHRNKVVTYFIEDASHISDYTTDFFYQKNAEKFITYMKWSKDRDSNTISLIPTNTKYASYLFFVDTSAYSLEIASYVIWRYFTNNHSCNKRQGFKITEIFKLFGIYKVYK